MRNADDRPAKNKRVRIAIVVTLALAALSPLALAALNVPDIDAKLYLDDVKYLASPELKGRATGSPELEAAGAHIAGLFERFGLKPVDGQNYELAFPAEIGAKLGSGNAFSFTDGGPKRLSKSTAISSRFLFPRSARSRTTSSSRAMGSRRRNIITTITPTSTSRASWC